MGINESSQRSAQQGITTHHWMMICGPDGRGLISLRVLFHIDDSLRGSLMPAGRLEIPYAGVSVERHEPAECWDAAADAVREYGASEFRRQIPRDCLCMTSAWAGDARDHVRGSMGVPGDMSKHLARCAKAWASMDGGRA